MSEDAQEPTHGWAGRAPTSKGSRETAPRRYRATVEYDGTDFAGFQVNPGKRTVQGALEDALARLGDGVVRRVDGAGRTDAGVHALGQVIGFSYAGRLDVSELETALAAVLPRDVTIRDIRPAAERFNPRYAARYREYRYTDLERATESAPRTDGARGARHRSTRQRWREPRRPSSAGTTSGPSGPATGTRSGP